MPSNWNPQILETKQMNEDIEKVLDDLEGRKKEYGLMGVELSKEDAILASNFMAGGLSREEAYDIVLSGIRQCLDDGLDD